MQGGEGQRCLHRHRDWEVVPEAGGVVAAEQVAGVTGLPVVTEDGFRETDFGDWEGLTFAEVRERFNNVRGCEGVTFDEEVDRRRLIAFLDRAQGCHVEVILKDISTVRYRPQNLWDWARIAMEVVEEDVRERFDRVDDAQARRQLKHGLEAAADGEAALKLVKEESPDLVLLDISF